MMHNRTLPKTDLALKDWSVPFINGIAADAEAYGVTTAMRDEAVAAHAAFAVAWELASNPLTRTRGAISGKDAAATVWRRVAGLVIAVVRAQPNVTDAQRIGLGLPPRATGVRVDAPTSTPFVAVTSVDGRTVHLRVSNSESERRGRPAGVAGLVLLSYAGEQPPNTIEDWKYQGTTSGVSLTVTFDESLPIGHMIWFSARWLSPRLDAGPPSKPIYAYLGHAMRIRPRGMCRAA